MTGDGPRPAGAPVPRAGSPEEASIQRAAAALARLPHGAVDAARSSVAAGWALLGDAGHGGDPAVHLVQPLLLEPEWPHPTPPLPVGDGAVHADLTDDDHDALARLRQVMGAGSDPIDAETLATAAQEWRLAVTPYRRLADDGATPAWVSATAAAMSQAPAVGDTPSDGARRRPAELTVVDLSALWAGPLATSLLAELGARVVKVDPDVRPDGLRQHPAFYRALNGAKEIVDLDLRVDADRRRFEWLLDSADLVVDSFSRRVMPNLGYGRDDLRCRFPHLASLSIVAFPLGTPEQDWLSYGPGVHATVGLGDPRLGGGPSHRYRPAPVAYPDALAGLAAFAVAAELVTRPQRGGQGEVSLAGALAPLVSAAGAMAAGSGIGR